MLNDTTRQGRAQGALGAALMEYRPASSRYGKFISPLEGAMVLLEEIEEFKHEVFKNPANRDAVAMRAEAVQVAAMTLRFIVDVRGRSEEQAVRAVGESAAYVARFEPTYNSAHEALGSLRKYFRRFDEAVCDDLGDVNLMADLAAKIGATALVLIADTYSEEAHPHGE